MAPGSMIVNLRRDHQFIDTRQGDELLQSAPNGIWVAHDSIGHGMFDTGPLRLCPETVQGFPWWLQRRWLTAAKIDELDLKRRQKPLRLPIAIGGHHGDPRHGVR